VLVEDSDVGLDTDEEDEAGCDEEDCVCVVVADVGAGPGAGDSPIVHVIKDPKPMSL
jgi:hypothetical protein